MSDWDDFMFYEAEREDNDEIPIEGDPFIDPEDFTEEAEETEEIPDVTREYHSREDFVCSYLVNFILNYGYQPDWYLELTFHSRRNLSLNMVPWKKTTQRPNMIPITDLVSDNGKGDFIPDLDKIRKALKELDRNL